MSVILDIKQACEKRLKDISTGIFTAYEGVDFKPPSGLYQRCQFVIMSPEDPVFGTGYYRQPFQFQVFVVFPKGKGTKEGIERAEVIWQEFKKGTFILEGTTRIYVLETPKIAGTAFTQDSMVVPVIINMVAEVYEA